VHIVCDKSFQDDAKDCIATGIRDGLQEQATQVDILAEQVISAGKNGYRVMRVTGISYSLSFKPHSRSIPGLQFEWQFCSQALAGEWTNSTH
jgi:hypothetical protein